MSDAIRRTDELLRLAVERGASSAVVDALLDERIERVRRRARPGSWLSADDAWADAVLRIHAPGSHQVYR